MTSGLYCGPPIPPAEILLAWRLDGITLALIAALVWLGRGRPAALWAAGGLGLLYLSPLCALSAALFSARAFHHGALAAGIRPSSPSPSQWGAPGGAGGGSGRP